jgi:hypothetical protein
MSIQPNPTPNRIHLKGGVHVDVRDMTYDPRKHIGSFRTGPERETQVQTLNGVEYNGRIVKARFHGKNIDGSDLLVEFFSVDLATAAPPAGTGPRNVRARGSRPPAAQNAIERLTRVQPFMYRGDNGRYALEVARVVGVGPIRETIDKLAELHDDRAVTATLREVAQVLADRYGAPLEPADDPIGRLGALKSLPKWATNHHSLAEHIDPRVQINSEHTGPRLASATLDPRIAILYAYRIYPDRWEDPARAFQPSGPQPGAFVAVIDGKDRRKLKVPPGPSSDEAQHRADRDWETPLHGVVPVVKFVQLPAFNLDDYWGSLNIATRCLIDEQVATA